MHSGYLFSGFSGWNVCGWEAVSEYEPEIFYDPDICSADDIGSDTALQIGR